MQVGWPELPQYERIGPAWYESFHEKAQRALAAVGRRFEQLLGGPMSSMTPPPPAAPTGTPWPWQAADPVGSNTIVNLATGNVLTVVPIVSWPGVDFTLFHNSLGDTGVDALGGHGWSHSYSARLDIDGDDVVYIGGDGAEVPFDLGGGSSEDNRVYRLKLERIGSGPYTYKLTDDAYNVVQFDDDGLLESLADASGNQTTLTYSSGRLDEVEDEVGRTLLFHYPDAQDPKIDYVEAPPLKYYTEGGTQPRNLERRWEFEYLMSGKLKFAYSPVREKLEVDEQNPPLYFLEFGYDGSKIDVLHDFQDNVLTLDYDATSEQVTVITHPAVKDFVVGDDVQTTREYAYTSKGDPPTTYITTVTDERGNDSDYTFDASQRLVELADQLDRVVTELTWTDLNRIDTQTNVLGGVTEFTYNSAGDPTVIDTPRGYTEIEYDTQERVHLPQEVTVTVSQGVTQTTEYDYGYEGADEDNPTRVTRIKGPGTYNFATFTWTDGLGDFGSGLAGLPEDMTDPNAVVQGYQYTDNGNPHRELLDPDEDDCRAIGADRLNSSTGETNVRGHQDMCPCCYLGPAGEDIASCAKGGDLCDGEGGDDCQSECLPENLCECPVCGCATNYNAAGSEIDKRIGCGEGASGLSMPIAYECYTDGYADFEAKGPFRYDGNEQLVCAQWIRESTGEPEPTLNVDGDNGIYYFEYDARHRLKTMTATDTTLNGPEPYWPYIGEIRDPAFEHVYHHPGYIQTRQYSDTTGKLKTGYSRKNPAYGTEGEEYRTFNTLYETDAAGRITKITRTDIKGMNEWSEDVDYAYADSTVNAAVTVTFSDGATSLYYVDNDFQVRNIEHSMLVDKANVLIARFEYTRDALGRITLTEETLLQPASDPPAYDHYERQFTYGDGNLSESDLDAGRTLKKYWGYLNDDGDLEKALSDSDPNRLVRERRVSTDDPKPAGAVEWRRDYCYDMGGNRLSMLEYAPDDPEDPGTDDVTAVTRYNYHWRGLQTPAEGMPPGMPNLNSGTEMNYDGVGRNRLMSTQKYLVPATGDPVDFEVVDFDYAAPPAGSYGGYNVEHFNSIGSKTLKQYTWDHVKEEWVQGFHTITEYLYKRDRLEFVEYWSDTE